MVDSSANSSIAFCISLEDMAGNSSTWMVQNVSLFQRKEIVKTTRAGITQTYSAINQKCLEAADPVFNQGFEFVSVPRNDTAIKANVNPALSLRSPQFLLESSNGGGWWNGIQRHVNHCRDTTEGRGLGACIESLPLGPPWFV